ncbi:hypothetical protein SLEP1_g31953 [Rubroshorea leprosula]|uniref:Uncharacterized protein n=1 Tax=Rubroshorea leprosula TaxID=152421 RepID=A0AAV5KBW3_9ROSI|nr:hypothetical protein SLEP1_g31953 [Rubroshorea leprosula]
MEISLCRLLVLVAFRPSCRQLTFVPVLSRFLEDQRSSLVQFSKAAISMLLFSLEPAAMEWRSNSSDSYDLSSSSERQFKQPAGGAAQLKNRLKFNSSSSVKLSLPSPASPELNLTYNSFNSMFPSKFDKLAKWRHLNLSNSGFTVQISLEISRMTSLVTLDFSIEFLMVGGSLKLENPNLVMLLWNRKELKHL